MRQSTHQVGLKMVIVLKWLELKKKSVLKPLIKVSQFSSWLETWNSCCSCPSVWLGFICLYRKQQCNRKCVHFVIIFQTHNAFWYDILGYGHISESKEPVHMSWKNKKRMNVLEVVLRILTWLFVIVYVSVLAIGWNGKSLTEPMSFIVEPLQPHIHKHKRPGKLQSNTLCLHHL